jgi:hypothetical protein
MKIDQLLSEHKKGVKAVKYAKKPTPLIGPEAVKRKEQQKKKAAVKKVEPMAESTDDEENYYYVVRHQTEKDIELDMPSKMWTGLKPKHATYEEAKSAYENLKNKHPGEKFTVTRHPRTSYIGGSPSKQFPENMSETAKLSTREKFKRSLKRAGYDPDAGAKRIEDLLAKQKKEREEREKQEQENDMKEAKQPEAPKPRNFVAKNAKTVGAGKHKDAKKAAKEVRGQKHKNKELAEAEMAKIVDYKPGQTATLNTGPGMTTIVDLKKNPTSLTKDPATGKLKLMGPQAQGTPAATSTQASTIKPGDAVEIGKVESISDILRLSGLN